MRFKTGDKVEIISGDNYGEVATFRYIEIDDNGVWVVITTPSKDIIRLNPTYCRSYIKEA